MKDLPRRRASGSASDPIGSRTSFTAGLRAVLAASGIVIFATAVVSPVSGAPGPPISSPFFQTPPLDTASLAEGPYAQMLTLDRRGFLFIRVDVLTVRVRFDRATADRFRRLTESEMESEAVEDSVADAAARATDAFAEIVFHRTIRLDQFVDATRENLGHASAAGYISEEDAAAIGDALPGWFDFLEERRIRDGDRLLYRIRGDSLRTVYLDPGDEVLLDQTDVGPERRLAVLGGYFAPGTDFREGLIGSLTENR